MVLTQNETWALLWDCLLGISTEPLLDHMTIFHRGQFYTVDELAQDKNGLKCSFQKSVF